MVLVRATVRLPYTSGLARDVAENVFHFEGTGSIATVKGYWDDKVQDFYSVAGGTGLPQPALPMSLGSFIAPIVNRALCQVSWAEVDPATGDVDPELLPRQALTVTTAGATSSLPLEVAMAVSFKAQAVIDTGGIPARAKGRVFVGPFHTAAPDASSGALPRPSANLQNAALNSLARLIRAGNAAGGAASTAEGNWVIYSRTSHVAQIVDSGWVDNQWDTQRRRGQDPTLRIAYP